jgi:hypothetical protein
MKKCKIDYIVPPERQRKDSFWYNGQVAVVSANGRSVSVEATGYMAISFDDENYDMPSLSFDNDFARNEARDRGYTDRKLKSFAWYANNWFTLYEIIGKGSTAEFKWVADSVAYNYDEAIKLAKYCCQHLDTCDLPKKSKVK